MLDLPAIETLSDKMRVRLAVCEDAVNKLTAQRQALSNTITKQEQQYRTARTASELLQILHNTLQQKTKQSLVSLVSYCLDYVFGDNAYKFDIKLEQKYNQASATPVFIRNSTEYPYTAVGGGVLDVSAFALRLSVVSLQGYKALLLDEPFRFVSSGYRQRICTLLSAITKQMGVQIIMVTHIKEFIDIDDNSVKIIKL